MATLLYHIKCLHSSYLYFSSSGEYFDLALKITCKTEKYCIKHRTHISKDTVIHRNLVSQVTRNVIIGFITQQIYIYCLPMAGKL